MLNLLSDNQMPIQQIVITEYIQDNGEQGLHWDASEGMSLWAQIGMLKAVLIACEQAVAELPNLYEEE